MLDRAGQVIEQVLFVPECAEYPDVTEQIDVGVLHALDEDRDPAAFEGVHHLGEDARPGRIDELELGHPQDHHDDSVEFHDFVEDPVR